MKRLGFNISKSSKRQKIIDTTNDDNKDVDVITTIEDSKIVGTLSSNDSKPLVIPVQQTKNEEVSVESIARSKKGEDNQSSIERNVKSNNNNQGKVVPKKLPLLLQNVDPELLTEADSDKRFRLDMKKRADDINFRSEIYDSVPVEQFGAALLRGMGWKDPDSKKSGDAFQIHPRENRLGLGAQPKPPDNNKKNSGARASMAEENKKHWDRKVEERLKGQYLFVHDTVRLRGPREYAGDRALVVAIRGVPGLDRIRVKLEKSGSLIEVPRSDAVTIDAEELQRKPYKGEKVSEADIADSANSHNRFMGVSDRTVKCDNTVDPKSLHAGIDKEKQQKTNSNKNHTQNSTEAIIKNWLREGIRVKIISKHAGDNPKLFDKCYLQKGIVLDVPEMGKATIRVVLGGGYSVVLESVKEKHLETVLPHVGGACRVLVGEHRGHSATLLEMHQSTSKAVIQLNEELDVVEVSLDEIAEYTY